MKTFTLDQLETRARVRAAGYREAVLSAAIEVGDGEYYLPMDDWRAIALRYRPGYGEPSVRRGGGRFALSWRSVRRWVIVRLFDTLCLLLIVVRWVRTWAGGQVVGTGCGDDIARIAAMMGIRPTPGCSCGGRRRALNARWPH